MFWEFQETPRKKQTNKRTKKHIRNKICHNTCSLNSFLYTRRSGLRTTFKQHIREQLHNN